MFAYCGNNPVCRSDYWGESYVIDTVNTSLKNCDGRKFLYYTTIWYHEERKGIFGRKPKILGSCATTFIYIVSNEGLITYDNNQDATYHLNRSEVRNALAYEMYRVARNQVPGAMKGRTVGGISSELLLHYKVFKWEIPFIYDNAEVAEMGSVNKKGDQGHDGNSWVFEILSWIF